MKIIPAGKKGYTRCGSMQRREGIRTKSLYVATYEGKIIGTVIYLSEQGQAYQDVDWQIDFDVPVIVIHILAVHPDYFGCGVGKALLDYAVYFGKKQGKKAIRLDTYEENLPAVRLYEKCGFQERGKVDLGLEPSLRIEVVSSI